MKTFAAWNERELQPSSTLSSIPRFRRRYWTIRLPQEMETSSTQSPYLLAFQAAQVKLQDKAFLSRDILVRELLTAHGDLHHIFPQNYLKKTGLQRGRYNQIANFVLAQSEVNIAISDKAPAVVL